MLALVALDALDDDFAGGALLGLAGLGGFGFGGFLLGVFFGALLGVYAEGGEVLGEGFGGVELVVEVGVGGGEPFGAFFGGAAEFTVLLEGGMLARILCRLGRSWSGVGVDCDEESYLLLGGASRRRSRRLTWADGRPRRLLCRP